MALGIVKLYTPSSSQVSDSTAYNTDMAALFDAFAGLEAQTSSLGGLTIVPSADGVAKFVVDNAAGNNILTVDTTNGDIIIEDTAKLFFDGSTAGAGVNTYIVESADDVLDVYVGALNMMKFTESTSDKIEILGSDLEIDATKKFYLDGGGDTYITESAANTIEIICGGNQSLIINDSLIEMGSGVQMYSSLTVDAEITIAAGYQLYLGTDTYLYEKSADEFQVVVGGAVCLAIDQDAKYIGLGMDYSSYVG